MRSVAGAAFVCVLMSCAANAFAHDPQDHDFEISFGQSQLFDIQPFEVGSRDSIPTTSAFFSYEHFLPWDLHAVALFNLPLSTYKAIADDGSVTERFASSSIAMGLAWSGLGVEIKEDVRVEGQFALLAGRVLTADGRYFPLGSVRAAIRRVDGFGLYIGVAGAFRVDTTALIYGVGHRF